MNNKETRGGKNKMKLLECEFIKCHLSYSDKFSIQYFLKSQRVQSDLNTIIKILFHIKYQLTENK